ncbi:MAG: hypothetical protein L7U55_05480 [Candidatus Nanopelagicales bacterium]|nr:hypothetical protein [Candidatus Nanopelagicales bacterium]MCH1463048.1 hypothetical protein [Candidatus Nanopelagicales bacterium]MCH9787332.1 hypothetical protein [Actinomycetes bacterium]
MLHTLARLALGVVLVGAGISHFTDAESFLSQVPSWLPAPDAVVAISGIIEVVLGVALVAAPRRFRPLLGWVVAAFFVAIFPGNISQFVSGTPGFGLDSDAARFIRLLFQPVLVVWALWCTDAWSNWRRRSTATR